MAPISATLILLVAVTYHAAQLHAAKGVELLPHSPALNQSNCLELQFAKLTATHERILLPCHL
jgi:phosphotransferase system IIA component